MIARRILGASLVLALAACRPATPPIASQTASKTPSDTLYQRIGGIDVLRSLVDAWILEAGSDPRIRDFFAGADIARVKLRLVERLCVVVEGPCLYRGAELREHHAGLGIEERHMRAFLEDLEPAMTRVKIAPGPARELREAMLLLGAQIGTGTRTSDPSLRREALRR
tara:strand:+ start:129 stop:632 length:504 start_codon:yes stop_codon:yes gene_type:complete